MLYYFILLFFPIGIVLLCLIIFQKWYQLKDKRAPFTDNFLRSPGQSLNDQIQKLNEKAIDYILCSIMFPTIIWFGFFQVYIARVKSRPFILLVLAVVVVVAIIVFYMTKLFTLLKKKRILRLGYEGEVAAGQELNQLMLEGYHVYHDFPADKFNIDHIVAGPSGVYAVETKARSKSVSKTGSVNAKVIYNGKTIDFPNYSDTSTLQQAVTQANWLQKWLAKAVGEPVKVQPLVALPGWYVERTSGKGIPVLNPKKGVSSYLKNRKSKVISESMITRIVHQLDQKCRDVEPISIKNS